MKVSSRLNPLGAIADQAFLSLLGLTVSMILITTVSKQEYGYYVLLGSMLLLVQSIQNALINSPVATLLPASGPETKEALKRTAVTLHMILAGAGALLAGVLLWGYLRVTGDAGEVVRTALCLGFALAVMGTVIREAQRSLNYVQGQGIQAFLGDLVYGALLLAGLGLAAWNRVLDAATALALTGLAATLPLLGRVGGMQGAPIHRPSMTSIWSCARWALPSVLLTWINLTSFSTVAAYFAGLAAVADLGASRLFVMPLGLLATAWGNWYRPKFSGWLPAGDVVSVRRVTNVSSAAAIVFSVVLTLVLLTGYPWIEPLLGAEYSGLQALVLAWLVYFTLAFVRNVYMATLMTDPGGYRILHHVTMFAVLGSVPCYLVFAERGPLWIIGTLCVVEVLQLALIVPRARHYWERRLQPS